MMVAANEFLNDDGAGGIPAWCYKDDRGRTRQKERCGDSSKRGCGGYFHPKQLNYSARLCEACTNRAAAEWDLPYEYVGFGLSFEANQEWYKERMPELRYYSMGRLIRSFLWIKGIKCHEITPGEVQLAHTASEIFPPFAMKIFSMPDLKVLA